MERQESTFRDLQFPQGFLWGAASAAHQVEGYNVNSDTWTLEQTPGSFFTKHSGERIEYMRGSLAGLGRAISDGIDVRAYLHLSLLDNYEWGSWTPTFGLVSIDCETFTRTVKPSARWLGQMSRCFSRISDKYRKEQVR